MENLIMKPQDFKKFELPMRLVVMFIIHALNRDKPISK